jgi:hypothetical protein
MSRPAVEIRPVEPGDIEWLGPRLRLADQLECHASGADDPVDGIRRSVADSVFARVLVIDNELVAIGGCVEHPLSTQLSPIGVPWVVGTPRLIEHPRVLQREGRRYIAAMLERYPQLVNVVHAANTHAVGWLRHMGFSLSPPAPWGPRGALFHIFQMRA